MGDSFTEKTHTSWSSRIGASLKGLLLGLLFIVVGVVLLFWNEGRAVQTHQALEESQGQVITIDAQSPATQMDGQLVHITGEAVSDQTLEDDLLPISIAGLKLQRYVETYQWEERKESEEDTNWGGGTDTTTTYTYSKVWTDELIDSSRFKHPQGHENPAELFYTTQVWTANDIAIGQYSLSDSHKNEINNFQTLPLPETLALPKQVKKTSNTLYVGKNPNKPNIGDQRIRFSFIPAQAYSAIGDASSSGLVEHVASNGHSIALLQPGIRTADAMFEQAKRDNMILTWILRLVGSILLVTALNMILSPLSVLADVVPLIGAIVRTGTGIVSFLLGITLALATISVAWIFYRPLVGLTLLVVAAGFIYLLKRKSKQASQVTADSKTAVIAE